MARRKAPKGPTPIRRDGPELVLMGDVRQAPIEMHEGGRTFSPVIALWVRAEDGYVVGQLADEPGHPAQTLVQALRAPVSAPGHPQTTTLPSQVVLFDQELAKQVEPMLAPLHIKVMISPPFEPFEDLFADLFARLQQGYEATPMLDLPEDTLRSLISAAERLWRARPWEYTPDYPPFALVPAQGNARPLYASVLGANKEIFGVALYSSVEDYETTMMLGESTMGPLPEAMPAPALEEAAIEVLEAFRHRAFLVSFESKDEVPPTYQEQLARSGWSRRLSTVPTFAAMGGGQEPGLLNAEEAIDVALAIDSLVAFCQRHRKQIASEAFPIRDTVEVSMAAKTVRVDVSVPGEDPTAPRATVYQLKVSLLYQKDVWRTIDVRSDQTLEDLHYAIQEAFNWDDDHLYAFFLSGKAWDSSTEYIRPGEQQLGRPSARVRLGGLGLRTRKRFLYIFDFGDEWRHEIRVEKSGLPTDEGAYPRIVDQHGEAPPQYGDAEEDYEEEEEEDE